MSHVFDAFKATRESNGHTVTSLAKLINVSDRLIFTLENGGEVDNAIAQRLADALGQSIATLGGREI